jgi:phenylpropionate dioxygenase-like ring-hydroxylating dioxygenase large terminal subunit
MKTLIPTAFYSDPSIFHREQSALFQDQWHFVGFTFDLKNHHDYICTEVGGYSVVIQNFDGDLKGFHNVCSHRFSPIRTNSCGNGVLQCPYHGWIYNREGIPYAIPKRPRFETFDAPALEALSLESWQVETCGSLVFTKKPANGVSLVDYLGESYDDLVSISSAVGPKLDCNEMVIKSNWKIVVENTLESYHVGFIHPQTFNKLGASGFEFKFNGPHSSWTAPLADKVNKSWSRVASTFSTRPLQVDGYLHHLIFPNLTIATTFGASFSVQLFKPLNAQETHFTSWVFSTQLDELSNAQESIVDMMNQSVIELNRSVFAEDKAICEQVQIGTSRTGKAGVLSEEEYRVFEFQKAYMGAMSSI